MMIVVLVSLSQKHGDQDIFVHISAFPKDGKRPSIGEKLSFEFQVGQDGKKEAKNLQCLDRQRLPNLLAIAQRFMPKFRHRVSPC